MYIPGSLTLKNRSVRILRHPLPEDAKVAASLLVVVRSGVAVGALGFEAWRAILPARLWRK